MQWTHSSPKVMGYSSTMKGNNYVLTDAKNIQSTNVSKTAEYGNPAAHKNGGVRWSVSHHAAVFVCLIITFLQHLPTNTPCLVWRVGELQYVCTRAALMLSHRRACGRGVHASRSVASMFLQPWQKNRDASKQTAEYGGKRFMATVMI